MFSMNEDVSADQVWLTGTDGEASLKQLSHVLAHRLRGLVTSIEGFADLLTDSLGSREQRELLLRIFEGTTRIERVLADLQRYSQPILPVPRTVHPAEVISDLLVALEEDEPHRLVIDMHVEPVPFRADPLLLRQALLMLVQNALEAARTDTPVRVSVREEPVGTLSFAVWNEGAIPVERAEEKVFAPFYTTKAHNLGVGLPIARHIAEAHGGYVQLACNSAEQGTCFVLALPMHALEQESALAA